jgi:fructoselysine 6-kinase
MTVTVPEIATMGDNCIDLYLPPYSVSGVGGQALNVAVILSRLGWVSEYLGAVGDDPHGRRITQTLDSERVITSRVQVKSTATATTDVQVLPHGDRLLLNEVQGACEEFQPTAEDFAHLVGVRHVHAANLPNYRTIARKLAHIGVPMSYDFSTSGELEDLEGIAIGFYSSNLKPESEELNAFAAKAINAGLKTVVITCGEFGSVVFENGERTISQATAVEVVDTCGAGDTYAAAFISERLKGSSMADAMAKATTMASQACLHLGAWVQAFEDFSTRVL